MAEIQRDALGRRAFLAGSGLLLGCARSSETSAPRASALLADAAAGVLGPVLFWNTASSRAGIEAPVPTPFHRFMR